MSKTENKALEMGRRRLLRVLFSRTTLVTLLLISNFLLLFAFLFELVQGLPVLFGSMVVFTAVMEVLVLNSRDNASVKLTWSVIIAILPLFGAVVYFFIRMDLGHRLTRGMTAGSLAESLAHLPEQRQVQEKIAVQEKDLQPLAEYLRKFAQAPAYENTQVTYYPLGEKKFAAMLEALDQAERFIFLEYFIVAPGHMWSEILKLLERKSAQGVEVRVLYDGMNALYNLPYGYPKELEAKGIKAKMYAPIRPFISTHYNNRDHRKILVVDGHTAFTGGVNIEDCYINLGSRYGHWKDTAIKLHGDAARGFTLLFLQMWNANESRREFAAYLEPQRFPPSTGYVIPFGDAPGDGEKVGKMVYLDILNRAKKYVYIMTPYLILDGELTTALRFAAKRGVDVQLILPHVPDKRTAFALAKSHYRELLEAGVKIFEYTPGFVHAKVFLCDDVQAVVGTINLDYRSLYHHFECGAYLYKVPALMDIGDDFAATRAKSQAVTLRTKENPLMRLLGVLLKFFAPLM